MSEPITIGKIETTPEHDPYANIDGIVSRTVLKLDPIARELWVTQEYNDNSTPMREWHGLILTWSIPSHPSEAGMREWIEDHMSSFRVICDGYEVWWDGNNHVGRYRSLQVKTSADALTDDLDNDAGPINYYEVYDIDTWLSSVIGEIEANMTDEQLADLAEQWGPDAHTIITGRTTILDYITARRDDLRAELED